MRNSLLTMIIVSLFLITVSAQDHEPCLTDQIHENNMSKDHEYKKTFKIKSDRISEAPITKTGCITPIVIPVAVHFQQVSTPIPDCLVELAENQVRILNVTFLGRNADILSWINESSLYFPWADYGRACFQFELATRNHPSGYGLSNGEPAVTVNQTSGDFSSAWSGYLNIFVKDIPGTVQGYAPLGGNGNGDGITLDVRAIGSITCGQYVPSPQNNLGRVAVHEVGHYFFLKHIWGNSTGCNFDDDVTDTPTQLTAWSGCPTLGVGTCNWFDMFMNYMDYTNDDCRVMFTAGQVDRMENYALQFLQRLTNKAPLVLDESVFSAKIQFNQNDQIVKEGTINCDDPAYTQSVLPLELRISHAPLEDVRIVMRNSGTAIKGEDFDLLTDTIVFPAGLVDTITLPVLIYADGLKETDEELTLSFDVLNNPDIAIPDVERFEVNITIEDDELNAQAVERVTWDRFNQTFEADTFPITWSREGYDTSAFLLGTADDLSSTGFYIPRDNSSRMVASNDARCDCDMSRDILITEHFDLDTPEVLEATLFFEGFFRGASDLGYSESATIYTAVDSSNLFNYYGYLPGRDYWVRWQADMSRLLGHKGCRILFLYSDDGQHTRGLAIDNVQLTVTEDIVTRIQTNENTQNGYAEHEVGPYETVHFYDQQSGNLMLTINNPSDHDYGCTKVEIDRSFDLNRGSTPANFSGVEDVTDKTFIITPEVDKTDNAIQVTLYYTEAELQAWEQNNVGFHLREDLRGVKGNAAINLSTTADLDDNTLVETLGAHHSFTSTFSSLSGGFTLGDALSLLPVELVELKATPRKSQINIEWRTAAEFNNKGFNLQRSPTGQNDFQSIAWIDGKGNTISESHYTFEDHTVLSNVDYYYRLKQIDNNGAFEFSNIVSAKIINDLTDIKLFPNPVNSKLTIALSTQNSNNVFTNIEIINILGKSQYIAPVQGDELSLEVDVKNWAAGVYIVRIYDEVGGVVSRRFVKE